MTVGRKFANKDGYSLTRGKAGEPKVAPRWHGNGLAPSAPRGDSGLVLAGVPQPISSVSQIKVGDVLNITRDGRESDMTVDRIDPAGSYGTSELDGPHVHAQIRSGGYAMTFDNSHLRDGRVHATKQVHEPFAQTETMPGGPAKLFEHFGQSLKGLSGSLTDLTVAQAHATKEWSRYMGDHPFSMAVRDDGTTRLVFEDMAGEPRDYLTLNGAGSVVDMGPVAGARGDWEKSIFGRALTTKALEPR